MSLAVTCTEHTDSQRVLRHHVSACFSTVIPYRGSANSKDVSVAAGAGIRSLVE